jgi:signal transduction histidine kinase
LKIILKGILFLSLAATLINLFSPNFYTTADSLNKFFPLITLIIFWLLNFFVIKGLFFKLSSFLTIIIFSLVSYQLAYRWGVMIPESWVILAFTIVLGGILIGSNFSFFLVLIHGIVLLLITFLQKNETIKYQSWDQSPMFGSILIAIFTFLIIAIVSWLSNKETKEALIRAKKSKKELKEERNNLEKKVEKRTAELKKVQLEKITNLYRLADFGKLTAGLFHDIANPLTQVALNLHNIEHQTKSKLFPEFKKIDPVIKQAINGTEKMEILVASVRNQIEQQETKSIYSPSSEISSVLETFHRKIKEDKISLDFTSDQQFTIFGNPVRFFQLVSNLVSNAIDSYYEIKREENRKIIINLNKDKENIILIIQDFGCGIPQKNIDKIYNPLFTTKGCQRGTGIGLYISHDIVEKELFGTIKVKSKINQGTTFTIKFPIKIKTDES